MPARTSAAPRFVSRRRPKLRVVGQASGTNRHACGFNVTTGIIVSRALVLEVWTSDEWAALHPAERPDGTAYVPGIGRALLVPATDEEAWDVADAAHQHEAFGRGL